MSESIDYEFEMSPSTPNSYSSIGHRPERLQPRRGVRFFGVFMVDARIASVFFALIALTGNISQSIALPLWLDSAPRGNSSATGPRAAIDVFFVPHFCSMIMFVFYASIIGLVRVFNAEVIGESERSFPNSFLLIIGVCGGTAGILSCFSSSATRTPPYLQAILSNFVIPLTILMRYLIIGKLPTRKKFLCAAVVMVCLFVSLIPSISAGFDTYTHGSGVARVLWPCCYMAQFFPTTFVAVMFEKIMKTRDQQTDSPVNLLYVYFWGSFYQMLYLTAMFWTDFIPGFGSAVSFQSFLHGYQFGLRCFVSLDGCTAESGMRGTVLVIGMMCSLMGSAALVRHGEGATLLAIVMSLTSPLVFIFWSLFQDIPPQVLWHPTLSKSTWVSLVALCVMVPAIVVYNTDSATGQKRVKKIPDGKSAEEHPLIS